MIVWSKTQNLKATREKGLRQMLSNQLLLTEVSKPLAYTKVGGLGTDNDMSLRIMKSRSIWEDLITYSLKDCFYR